MKSLLALLMLMSLLLVTHNGILTLSIDKTVPPSIATRQGVQPILPVATAPGVTLTGGSYFQGWAPAQLGLAISPDGKTAYVPFELDDSLLVVDLPTLTTIASIDISAAGNMLSSSSTSLTPDGKKLFVASHSTENVMVVGTEHRQVEAVLPLQPLHAVAISVSSDGSKAYVPSKDGGLYIVNVSDNSYQHILIPDVSFGPVVPAPGNSDLLYTVGTLIIPPETFQPSFFTFNVSSHTVERSVSLPTEVLPPDVMARRLVVNSAGTRAYFGYKSGFTDRGVGNFSIFDLNNFRVLATAPIENGVTDFTLDEQTSKAYIIGFWSGGGAPNVLPVHEWDLVTNSLIRNITVAPSSDQRAIQLDPTNSRYFYMTEGDHNFLRKVDIATGQEIGRVQFNREQLRPYAILRDGNIAYIVCQSSRRIFKLNLPTGQITGSIVLPFDFSGWGIYQGKLYVGSGNDIVAINPSDGSVVARYPLGWNLRSLLFTFYGNRMVAIDYVDNMIGRRLVVFDANTMTLLKAIDIPHEPHGDKVIVSPDGTKLYIERGLMMGGTTTITIYDASTLNVLNTIEIPPIDLHGATSFVEGDFDEANKILYLAGFTSVYKIDMDTNTLIGTLDVTDVYESTGSRGWSPSGMAGLILSASRNKLFIVSGDAHSMYTYDLTHSAWLTKITNVQGYFVTDALGSPDRRYLYTSNSRTDSITMIDLSSGNVERVIDLHDYVGKVYLPVVLKSGR